jgi:type I restriction enzyme S subunit
VSWTPTRLKYLAALPITNGLGEAAQDGDPAWPRYIRTTDIASPRALDESKRVTLPPSVAAKAVVLRDDLLLCAAGSLGKVYLHTSEEEACYAGYLVRFRPDKSLVDPRFVAYWAESQPFLDQIAVGAVRSTIDNFSASKYQQMSLDVPSLEEQRRIAAFLDDQVALLDRASDLRRRQSALFDEHLDAEASALLIGRMDPLRDGVQVRRFLRAMQTGGTPSQAQQEFWDEDGVPWFGPGSFDNGLRLGEPTKRIASQALVSGVVPTFPPGSVLIVGIGATAGRVAYSGGLASGNQQLTALVPASGIDGKYLAWSLWVRRRVLLATAPYTTLPILNNETLRSVRIAMHSVEEQAQIVNRLEALSDARDAASALFEESRALLAERKQALITAAVTGQFDVTTARSAA